MKRSSNVGLIALFSVALIVGATACGGGAKADSPSATAAVTNEAKPATQAAPTIQAPAPTATTADATLSSLPLTAANLLFDTNELKATAGDVTIAFDNQDKGVPHNIHVFSGSDATGTSVGKTEIEPGPGKQSLALNLAKGSYFFQCDVHPTTMTGTITVE